MLIRISIHTHDEHQQSHLKQNYQLLDPYQFAIRSTNLTYEVPLPHASFNSRQNHRTTQANRCSSKKQEQISSHHYERHQDKIKQSLLRQSTYSASPPHCQRLSNSMEHIKRNLQYRMASVKSNLTTTKLTDNAVSTQTNEYSLQSPQARPVLCHTTTQTTDVGHDKVQLTTKPKYDFHQQVQKTDIQHNTQKPIQWVHQHQLTAKFNDDQQQTIENQQRPILSATSEHDKAAQQLSTEITRFNNNQQAHTGESIIQTPQFKQYNIKSKNDRQGQKEIKPRPIKCTTPEIKKEPPALLNDELDDLEQYYCVGASILLQPSNHINVFMVEYERAFQILNLIGETVAKCLVYLEAVQNFWIIPLFLIFKRMYQLRSQAETLMAQHKNPLHLDGWQEVIASKEYKDFTVRVQSDNHLVEVEMRQIQDAALRRTNKLEQSRQNKVKWFLTDDLQQDIKETSFIYLYTQVLKNVRTAKKTKEWRKLTIQIQYSLMVCESALLQYKSLDEVLLKDMLECEDEDVLQRCIDQNDVTLSGIVDRLIKQGYKL